VISSDVYEVTGSEDKCRAMLLARFYLNDYLSISQGGHILAPGSCKSCEKKGLRSNQERNSHELGNSRCLFGPDTWLNA
jgi:hypothetical protein